MIDTNAVAEAVNAISDLANGFGGTNSITAIAKGVVAAQPTDWVKVIMEATALVTALTTLLGIAGRMYHSMVNGGGLIGGVKGALFGTNSPKPPEIPNEQPAPAKAVPVDIPPVKV